MNATEDMTAGSMAVQTGVTGAAIAFVGYTLADMVPFLIVSVVLIIADLFFGIKAASVRGDKIRLSRAIRRTVGKAFEYLCWVLLSSTLSIAFEAQAIEWVILGIIMGNEVISITSNFFEAHGKRISGLNIWKIVGDKANVDLTGVKVESITSTENKEEHGNDK